MNIQILTGNTEEHVLELDSSGIFLHKEVIGPFKQLQQQARQDIGADLQIVSGFRSYQRQLKIWNDKASGKRALLDKNDHPLPYETLTPQQIVQAILMWSAIPGTSRHHWGTDMDIFDAKMVTKQEVKLIPSECGPGGVCEQLHLWLDQYLPSSPFFRPYDTDKGGTGVEKWHLSYAPISQKYFEEFTLELLQQHLEQSEIIYKEILLNDLPTIYQRYLRSIDLP